MQDKILKKALGKLLQKNVSILMNQSGIRCNSSCEHDEDDTMNAHKKVYKKGHTHHDNEIDSCQDDEDIIKHNMKKFTSGFGLFGGSDKCHDLFLNVKIRDQPMYLVRNAGTQLRFKFNQRVLNEELVKLRFIIGVGGLNDIFFIKAILKKKAVVKEKFVLELEQGQEVYIPKDLTQDHLPASFRYYDPIIQISNNLISKQSKIYHSFKTEFNLNKIKGSDWKRDLMMDIGFLDRPENKKVTHKHAIRNLMEQNEI